MKYVLTKEVVGPLIVILVCFLLCIISKKIVYKMFNFKGLNVKDGKKKTIINLINNIIKFIIIAIGIFVILEIYGIDTKSLVASFGVVGLVAGLALQDILKDFIVGISIIFEGQYSIGDWVSINGFKGEIIPSNLRTTKLRAYTGEIKMISNRNITEIINYSLGNTHLVIDVDVAYESDVEQVKQVLDKLCIELKQKHKLKEISCVGIQELSNSSIKFRLVVLSNYSDQFSLEREIKKEIILTFEKNNITIPYNQVVVHNGKRV